MPNWCFNRLTITGPTDQVEDLVARARTDEEELSFQALLPCTEDETLIPDPDVFFLGGLQPAWYVERCQKWGTKWEPDGSALLLEQYGSSGMEGMAVYGFSTAWTPPKPLFTQLAKDHPSLTIRLDFEEPNNCFAGCYVWSSGILHRHDDHLYVSSDEEEDQEDAKSNP